MRRALLLTALLCALPGHAGGFGVGREFSISQPGFWVAHPHPGQVLLNFADTSYQGQLSPPMCTAASQLGLLSGSYACLNGDGTQDSSTGMTLSAVGSPTTQTMEWCPNGLGCAALSRQVLGATADYYQGGTSSPAGAFSACALFAVVGPLPATPGANAASLVAKDGVVSNRTFSLNTAGGGWGMDAFVNTGTITEIHGGTVVSGAFQVGCLTYDPTAAGGTETLYLDGAQVAQATAVGSPASSNSEPINLGFRSGDPNGKLLAGAFYTEHLLTSTEAAQLAAALVPIPHGTRGEALTFTRNSLASCTAPDGTVSWLPPGRPCISGGLRVRPAVTNLLTYSEQFDNVVWTATSTTVTANAATAPDGTTTADTLTSTVAGGYVSQSVTSGGSGYMCSAYADVASGTQAFNVQLYDVTGAVALNTASCTATTSWPATPQDRCIATVASTTSTHTVECRIYPGGTGGTGTIEGWGAQLVTGSVASDYCRSEGTSATCAAEAASLPMPESANANEGCAEVCVAPTWTGARVAGATGWAFLEANDIGVGTARFFYVNGSDTAVRAYDGTTQITVAAGYTVGTSKCYRLAWSKSAGTFRVDNITDGVMGTAAPFSGFSAFGAALRIGSSGAPTTPSLPANATISSLTLGTSPGGCR